MTTAAENASEHIALRSAVSSDGFDLAALRWAWRTERHGPPDGEFADFAAAFVSWFEPTRDSHPAIVAEVDGALVAMGFIAFVERVPDPLSFHRLQGDIQSVYVSPEFRNAGLGSELVRRLIELASDAGCASITVQSGTRAVPVYERLGFAHVDRHLALTL